jgi:RNA ligase (TIGR02306 family)
MLDTELVKSTHRVEVVPIVLETHPNADALSVVRVFGYQVVVRTEDWENVQLGAYIPPDSVAPDTSEFEFLGDHKRIKVRRFRGVFSQGMLMPVPEGAQLGDNVADIMGITRYEPPENYTMGGQSVPAPEGFRPKYDVDAWQRYKYLFKDGEEVVVTEKIHGANARFTCVDGEMYCGSRTMWKKELEGDLWWRCLAKNGWIEEFCRVHPDFTVYGEVYGNVQSLKYGAGKNDIYFAAFDLWHNKDARFLNWEEVKIYVNSLDPIYDGLTKFDLVWVPVLYEGPYSEALAEMADGLSEVLHANNIREGVVIHPIKERVDLELGRVKMKCVSNKYLEKDK